MLLMAENAASGRDIGGEGVKWQGLYAALSRESVLELEPLE